MFPLRFGAVLSHQATSWPAFRDAALAAEAAGFDSIWTWDHLLASDGPPDQPVLEGWMLLAALAPITTRPTLGLMVAANTFRSPALTAKIVTTLDHLSDGRAILGIGAGWLEREHDAFGIDFDGSMGERLDRMDEAIVLIRRLLDGERFDHEGRFYRFHDAWLSPRPIQAHLPILIGGSGPKKTLRTLARHADMWNEGGDLATMLAHDAILRERCAEVGRDPETIERTLYCHVVLRDDPAEARQVHEVAIRAHGMDPAGEDWGPFLGSSEAVAADLGPYVKAGFSHLTMVFDEPYDLETIGRAPELRALLEA